MDIMRPSEGCVAGSIPAVGTKLPSRAVHSGSGFSLPVRGRQEIAIRGRSFPLARYHGFLQGFLQGVRFGPCEKSRLRVQKPYKKREGTGCRNR